jgi:hypothetical protein
MVDLDKMDEIEAQRKKEGIPVTFEMMQLAETSLNIGNMSPQQSQLLNRSMTFPPNKESLKFNIFINARNGWFTELLRLHKVDGEWKTALKVTKDNYSDTTPNATPTLLLEQVDPGFPRSQDGQVEW